MSSRLNPAVLRELIRQDPEKAREIMHEYYPKSWIARFAFVLFPYASITLGLVVAFSLNTGNYAGALASSGPFLAAIVATIGLYQKQRKY